MLKACVPDVPQVGNDRAMDNWLPLLVVADTAGDSWPRLARAAMVKMEVIEDADDGIGPMILHDVREVFEARQADRLFSDDLVEALIDMEERPWCEWKHGKPLTKNSLARLLKQYEIKSREIRIGLSHRKGYRIEDLCDAFERYLPPISPFQNATTRQANAGAGFSGFQNATHSAPVADEKTLKANAGAGCRVVADENRDIGKADMKRGGYIL